MLRPDPARPNLRLLCAALLATALWLPGGAIADPAAVDPTGPATADAVAVSVLGDASCTTDTCVAVSVVGDSTSGCTASPCEAATIIECPWFVCANAAVSVLGDADAGTYCAIFGSTCVAIEVDTTPGVLFCYTDFELTTVCRGAG